MSTFFLILGIAVAAGSFLIFLATEGDVGLPGMIIGIVIIFFSVVAKGVPDNEQLKNQDIVSDSISPPLPVDTIKSILYIISWKDEDGVWAGKNVKLVGYTEKSVGDTIVINLK